MCETTGSCSEACCTVRLRGIARLNQLFMFPYRYIDLKKYFTYRSVQKFKILFRGFSPPEFDPPHKIMRYWFYYSTQLGLHFRLINMIRQKYFVPPLYQFRRSISEGPALKYFDTIHRGGRGGVSEDIYE